MKRVYDMNTGRMLESDFCTAEPQRQTTPGATIPELQLQLVLPDSHPEMRLPPELAMADLNAFLDRMS